MCCRRYQIPEACQMDMATPNLGRQCNDNVSTARRVSNNAPLSAHLLTTREFTALFRRGYWKVVERLPYVEAFFVQERPVGGSHLDPPVTAALSAHAVTTVGAVAVVRIRPDLEIDRLIKLIVAIPEVLDAGIFRRLEPRVKRQQPRVDRPLRRRALPVAGCVGG